MTITGRDFKPERAGVAERVQPGALGTLAASAATTPLPPLGAIVYNRLAYGPRQGDIDSFNQLGADDTARLTAWLTAQLDGSIDDSACQATLNNARLKIQYNAYQNSADPTKQYPALNEARPLNYVLSTKSNDDLTRELWPLTNFGVAKDFDERMRPFEEVRVATWIRTTHSKRQLVEVLADFWHNHFNVNGSGETQVYSTFPVYDRIIRGNLLGNFRTFLEEIAKSTAMMYYLDNYNNKAGGGEGGNENYAREMFELHCFGTDNYYKFYDKRELVPKLPNSETPAGYIDKDVYQAAACLTGWTIDTTTGLFTFDGNTHDNGVKLVLNTIIDLGGGAQDATTVFDMLARHPNVAKNVCKKLVRRLIADDPPQSVIDAAAATWMSNLDNPAQLREVVRTIVLSNAFKTTWGQKVKRPFDAVIAFLRATDATLPVDQLAVNGKITDGGFWGNLFYQISGTGHKIFEWPTPTGHPDVASYWISSNSTLRRWNLPYLFTQPYGGNIVIAEWTTWNPDTETRTVTQIVDDWIGRLFGYTIDAEARSQIIAFFAYGGSADEQPMPTAKAPDYGKSDGLKERYRSMIQLLAASPDFHNR